jgi:DNA-binding NtrC family response regulator
VEASETAADGSAGRPDETPRIPGAALIYADGGPRFHAVPIPAGGIVLGRDPACELPIPDHRASRQHVRIDHAQGWFRVRDLGSRNGTRLDGRPLHGDLRAGAGAIIRIGHALVLLCDDIGAFADGRSSGHSPVDAVVGPKLAAAHDAIAALARAGSSVAIVGETGTGKELAARVYHEATGRSGPLVPINCATIPVGIAERVLFGAKKGAFSGATADAQGVIEAAHGGTLFLDELGELDPAVQAKLLRTFENGEVVPLGATRGRAVDVRVVAATHRDLGQDVAAHRFRADLYFRLAQPQVHLPALRERRDEIPQLVARAVASIDAKLGLHVDLVEACCLAPWPGNVRELLTALRSAAVQAVARGATSVRAEDLPHHDVAAAAPIAEPVEPSRELVARALEQAAGNLSAAARELGLHRTQLYRLMRRHGLER